MLEKQKQKIKQTQTNAPLTVELAERRSANRAELHVKRADELIAAQSIGVEELHAEHKLVDRRLANAWLCLRAVFACVRAEIS